MASVGLDSRFITDISLQEVFRDKDTGLPLRNGTLTFYEDCNRTTPKSVYSLSGGPSSYQYNNEGNVVTLDSDGTTPFKIYYFPYDGDPDTTTDLVTLYYVEIKSATGVNQENREAVPNFFEDTGGDTENLDNFVPNGQFRAHKNIGTITSDTECIAYGPWYFVRDDGSSSTDKITFNRLGTATTPERYPRYECQLQNTVAAGTDQYKDIRIRFKDVNKFASDTDEFTFKFSGRSKTGANVSVEAYIIWNFGTGGSPGTRVEKTIINAKDLTTANTDVQGTFTFGVNDGISLGSNDDDYVELAIRFPRDGTFTAAITDVVLAKGDVNLLEYPYITDEEDAAVYLGGSFEYPDVNGLDKYLPVTLGDCGLEFDRSIVGTTLFWPISNTVIPNGYFYCNGSDYGYDDSTSGVPNSRLGDVLLDNSPTDIPLFGTGYTHMTGWKATNVNKTIIHNNTKGSTTDIANGNLTGFTFDTAHTGDDYDAISYRQSTTDLWVETLTRGPANSSASAGTSGFSVSHKQAGVANELRDITRFTTVDAATLDVGAGNPAKYFEWSNTTTDYYIWYTVDGNGDNPNIAGRTGIEIHLDGSDTQENVMQKTRFAMNGFQTSTVIPVDGASINDGEYFDYSSTDRDYRVYFSVDGGSTTPDLSSKTGIKVEIASTDTVDIVATNIHQSINKNRFAVPDWRGQFIRGVDDGANVDPDAVRRYAITLPGASMNGDFVNTCQGTANLYHNHKADFKGSKVVHTGGTPVWANPNPGGNFGDDPLDILYSGRKESRPYNKSSYYIIHF